MKQLVLMLSIFVSTAYAVSTVRVTLTSADHMPIGTVDFQDSPYGLLIFPHLSGLPVGIHGFHLHEHPDCGDQGMSAGGHYDPNQTKTHLGPYGEGHLGDLPALGVNTNGTASTPLLAPRLKVSNLTGHTLMIHAGGDTYLDTPALGGGGARLACGVIP